MARKINVMTKYTKTEYITAGKIYEAEMMSDSPDCELFIITPDDEEEPIYCLLQETCAHLDDVGKWEIVE